MNLCKEVRKCLGMTQYEFSKLLGLNVMTISRYERGVETPPESKRLLFLFFKNCSPQFIHSIISELP